eukprot:scaffold243308_cov20-Prasinocladus_malaysianus.AAC.1
MSSYKCRSVRVTPDSLAEFAECTASFVDLGYMPSMSTSTECTRFSCLIDALQAIRPVDLPRMDAQRC